MATHVALHAERAVASLEGTFECCGVHVSASNVGGMTADGKKKKKELKLTTFACVAVNVDLEQPRKRIQLFFFHL